MTQEKKTLIVLGLLVAFIVLVLLFFGEKGPSPVVETQNRLRDLKAPVLAFAEEKGALPETLQELGLPTEATSDHAGKPFVYEINGRSVTISSLGADGKPGGAAFNADKSINFDW